MADAKHTETPWGLYADDPLVIIDAEGSSLGEMSAGDPYISYVTQRANAALVVTAINERSALLKCEEALRAHAEWYGKEGDGPAYPPGTTRDSEGGEAIWREWWNEQLELCRKATDLTRSALSHLEEVRHGK